MIEIYEGSSRYKEIRDIYEEKLQAREVALTETKNELIKIQLKMEYMAAQEKNLQSLISQKEEQITQN